MSWFVTHVSYRWFVSILICTLKNIYTHAHIDMRICV